MFKIDSSGNVSGLFTNGNPGLGVQPTVVSDEWLNAIQTEIVNVVQGAGLTLNKANSAQLLAALNQLYRTKRAYKRQFVYFNETTISGFNSHTIYNVGELPTANGEILEGTSAQIDLTILYSMVVNVASNCSAPIKFLFRDDAGLMFVDGTQVAGGTSGSTTLDSSSVALTAGDHVIQFLCNDSGGTENQLILAEWMTGLPITWLRAATS